MAANGVPHGTWGNGYGGRKAISIKALRERHANGEDTSHIQGALRMGRKLTQVAIGADDLSEWDDEELRRGMRRSKKGDFRGHPPVAVPKQLLDELHRRQMSKANTKLKDYVESAVDVLTEIMQDATVEPKDRLTAVRMVMDRVLGKEPAKVELSVDAPWLQALQGAIVSIEPAYEDAEIVNDDDDYADDEHEDAE